MDEFKKEFVMMYRRRHNAMTNALQIKKAYAAYRLLGCKINKIPKEWYK